MIRTLTLCAAAMSPLLLLADEPLDSSESYSEHTIRSHFRESRRDGGQLSVCRRQ